MYIRSIWYFIVGMNSFDLLSKMKLFLSLSLCIFALISSAQHPDPVLEKGDLDRFIETIGPISKEIRELGVEVSPMSLPFLDEVEGTNAIWEKYGWKAGFGKKWEQIVCLQAVADKYAIADIGTEKIMCDNLQLNPEDLKMVKPRSAEILEAIIASFTGG